MNQSKHPTWNLRQIPQGPLATYLDEFCYHLHEQGFCRSYIGGHIRHVARFSCWLAFNDIAITNISEHHVSRFLKNQNKRSFINQGGQAALRRFLKYLTQIGVALPEPNLPPLTSIQISLLEFGRYLLDERNLSPKTLIQYRPTVEKFLTRKFGSAKADLNLIVGSDIIQFIHVEAKRNSTSRGKVVVNAMRAFIRYGMHRYQLPQTYCHRSLK